MPIEVFAMSVEMNMSVLGARRAASGLSQMEMTVARAPDFRRTASVWYGNFAKVVSCSSEIFYLKE